MRSRSLAVLAVVPLLALGVTACGDDNDTSSTSTPASTQAAAAPAGKDIVALAQGTPDLSTLVKAVTAADLVPTLQGAGPFTVFAPTNAAFEAVPKKTLDALLAPEGKADLTKVLTYHVVPGKLTAADLKDGDELKTVEGQTLKVTVDGSTVKVNDATVVMPDVDAANGVVHVIDGVLIPPSS